MRREASVRPGCAAVDHGGCAELMVSFRTATVCVPLPHQLTPHLRARTSRLHGWRCRTEIELSFAARRSLGMQLREVRARRW